MAKSDARQTERRIVGLSCPACGGTLDLREGATVEQCSFCGTPLLLNIPGNVPGYSAVRRLDEDEAWWVVTRWLLSHLEEHVSWRLVSRWLPWLFERARMEETLLVYAPFWVMTGQVAGLLLGVERELVDHPVLSVLPAYDVSELPVRDILLGHDVVMPLDRGTLMRDGMVLKPAVSPRRAAAMAKQRILRRLPGTARTEWVSITGQRQVLLLYPLWVIRYRYWGRTYRAVVDGTEPRLLAGQMSDRLPKLVILISALGLLASFFGVMGFLVAGALAAILAPRLVGVGLTEEQYGSRLDARWGETDRTRVVPLMGVGSVIEERLAQLPGITESESFWQQELQADVPPGQMEGTWVIPLRCPTCGRALPAEDGAVLFYCGTCRQGVEYREKALRPVEVMFVEAEAGGNVPHPWWIVTVRGLDEDPLDIYVPAYRLPLSRCVTQGVYLTRRQPKLKTVQGGTWGTCTVSREDALRLAGLIYLSLDDDAERVKQRLALISMRMVVFLSE
jgi:predicted RNA-binding Zn-ribbon protein involved in translation (DUF1610 family)